MPANVEDALEEVVGNHHIVLQGWIIRIPLLKDSGLLEGRELYRPNTDQLNTEISLWDLLLSPNVLSIIELTNVEKT